MKCIRYKKTGNVDRLLDGDAEHYVRKGEAEYISKSEWKAAKAA